MSEFINTIDVLGDDVVVDGIIQRSLTEFNDDIITELSVYALAESPKLSSVNMPSVVEISTAFFACPSLAEVKLPRVVTIPHGAFRWSAGLRKADFSSVARIVWASFTSTSLSHLILRNADTIATLESTMAFFYTGSEKCPIGDGKGYIYVPKALLSDDDETKDYRRATNWSTYATQFRALEDYTVDGTITGELDETKI